MENGIRPPYPNEIFYDLFWEQLCAPVVPPASVVEEVSNTGRPVHWQNGHSGWISYYRTEVVEGCIVTRLCNWSITPTPGWLYRQV